MPATSTSRRATICGADVYLNGHPYILQQEWSNAASTCAVDLPTNGFCSGSVSNVCAPTTALSKSVDNATPPATTQITYTLTLNNTSNTGAETNLTLTDSVPAGYTVNSISAPSSTSSGNTSTSVTVSYDTLPVHQSRTVTITATVPVQVGVTATNCGSLAGSDLIGTALAAQTSSPCASTTPGKVPTVVTYTGPTSGDYNDPATLSANLTERIYEPARGEDAQLQPNGSETCSAVTDAAGTPAARSRPPRPPAPTRSTVAFSDATDPVYHVSSTSSAFSVTLEEADRHLDERADLALPRRGDGFGEADRSGRRGADRGQDGHVHARRRRHLHRRDRPSGVASCAITPHQAGTQNLVAAFAGDAYYLSSGDTKSFSITPEETTITYTGPTVILAGAGGVTLTAKLVEDGANDSDGDGGSPAPDPSETVTLSIGSQSCTATTSLWQRQLHDPFRDRAARTARRSSAAFAGDAYYQPSSDSETAIVFAFPSRGAFVLGNVTAARPAAPPSPGGAAVGRN